MKSLSWNNIKKYNFNAPKIILPRSKKVIDSYNELNELFKKIDLDMNNWIYKKYLNNGKDLYRIEKNDFPYFLNNNIKHMILWINPKLKKSAYMDKAFIIKLIKIYYNYNFVCFINNDNNKSIKGIPHYHIFFLINDDKISSLADSLIL